MEKGKNKVIKRFGKVFTLLIVMVAVMAGFGLTSAFAYTSSDEEFYSTSNGNKIEPECSNTNCTAYKGIDKGQYAGGELLRIHMHYCPVTWEQHKSNGIIDTVNGTKGYASLSDIETYGTNITYNHNFQTSSSYKGGNHKYYNEVVNYDTTRLEYLKLLQVKYYEQLALVATNDDVWVNENETIGGSNKNSNGSTLYWIVNEWDKDGNSLTMTRWYETNESYTVGTGKVADNQKQLTGYNDLLRYNVKYATLLFRWNNGDTNIGAGKDVIDRERVAEEFDRFYVCYRPFTYTFRDGPDMIRTIERFGVSDPFENTDYMLPDEADLEERPGYYLKGWKVVSGDPNDKKDNKQYGMIFTVEQLEEMMTSGEFYSSLFADTVFEAVWAPEEYKITYDLQGGTVSPANPTTYTVESNNITLNNPTKKGYKFLGWTGSNGTTPQTTVTIKKGSTGNRSYKANWERVDYNITYDLQGGTLATANPTTYNVETPTFTLNNPTKNGYRFLGWTGTNGTTPQLTVTITKGSVGDRSYTANWECVDYNITYDLQGGTVSPANPTTYNVETPTFTLNNPIKAGYKFTGWTGSNGTTPEVTVTITKGSTGDKSYTANWERIDYAITYDLQGGTVSPANPSTYHVETPTFTLNNPTRVGYSFIGWTGSNGTTPQLTVTIEKGSTGDRHYVANWETAEVDVTVRHYVMDVKGNFPTNPTKTNTVKLIVGKSYADDYGADYFKESSLEQEGIIIFSGYEFPSSGVVSATSSENVVKLYYSRKTYTVTFNVSENLGWWGASISDKEDRKYLFRHGEEINFADYVPKSHSLERDFIGWNTEVDGRRATTSYTVTSDVTFYAQFRIKKILGLTDASGRSQRTITLYNKEGSKRVVFPYLNTYRAWTEVSGSIGAGWTTANSIDAPNGLTAGYLEAHEYGIGVSLEVYGIYKGFANVVFDENGGKETDDTDDKIVNVYRNSGDLSKTKGGEVTLPNCTRDNTDNGDGSITVYTLGGWKCGEDFYPVGATVPITENTTFVAQWDTEIKYIEYTIVFDMNGGKFGPDPITVKYGQEVILPKKGSRVGFKLVDWCTTPDGTGVRYQPEVVVKNLTNVNGETVVLYAQWKQKDFLLVKISSSRYNATFIRRTEGDDAWFNSVGKITINEWATMTEEEKNAISKYRFHIDKDGNITQIS